MLLDATFHRHAHKRVEAIRQIAAIRRMSFSRAVTEAAQYARELKWECFTAGLGA